MYYGLTSTLNLSTKEPYFRRIAYCFVDGGQQGLSVAVSACRCGAAQRKPYPCPLQLAFMLFPIQPRGTCPLVRRSTVFVPEIFTAEQLVDFRHMEDMQEHAGPAIFIRFRCVFMLTPGSLAKFSQQMIGPSAVPST